MSASPPPTGPSSTHIDRPTTCPFLLNFTYRTSAFNPLPSFPIPTPQDPKPRLPPHVEIYTWMDCTLRELALLLTSALPSLVPEGQTAVGTRLVFRLVYPDMRSVGGGEGRGGRLWDDGGGRGRYTTREMGSVVISAPAKGKEDQNGHTENGTDGLDLGGEDADKTLEEARFVIGDFVDVAVFPPLSDGSVVSRGSAMEPTYGGRGGRENGYSARGGPGRGGGLPGGGYGRGRGDFGAPVPAGEWRRGERLPVNGSGGVRGGRGRSRY
ncbi:uncharacterized protein AB675_8024 [Cyphellophora attinorum]|uniref:Histone deacetylase complex subunit SAP18 n=1 Tax=Cyphellophora attinorum TaxID=1664694 RepID=A0A0N1HV63_9EURO|nr:uncharacterized protein AB675_8024 [Phialophora attinorum]KPI41074.1 hypothetical protein AB675_8024 [Phialophora attinorum]